MERIHQHGYWLKSGIEDRSISLHDNISSFMERVSIYSIGYGIRVNSVDGQYQELISHLMEGHQVSELVSVALFRNLAYNHPVNQVRDFAKSRNLSILQLTQYYVFLLVTSFQFRGNA